MPYNVISRRDDRMVLTHCLSAREALNVSDAKKTEGFEVRVVSIDGVDLTTERLERIARLEAPVVPPRQVA